MANRQDKILSAIVDMYIRTGKPVSSKVIADLPKMNFSAATVRNEMSALEEYGYLTKPHKSSGRVPTILGYQRYIDLVSRNASLPPEERVRIDAKLGKVESLTEDLILQTASTVLSELTQCTTVVSNFAPKYSVIAKVEVVRTGTRICVVLLVTSDGKIQNRACQLQFDWTNEELKMFQQFLIKNLEGVSISDLSEEKLEQMTMALGAYTMALMPIMQSIDEMMKDLQKDEVYVSGEENLFACPEFDREQVVQFVTQRQKLAELLDDSFRGLHVIFGGNNDFVIGNSSMILSQYQRGEFRAGALGVIGPLRLDYTKIIPYLKYFTEKISKSISKVKKAPQEIEVLNLYNESGTRKPVIDEGLMTWQEENLFLEWLDQAGKDDSCPEFKEWKKQITSGKGNSQPRIEDPKQDDESEKRDSVMGGERRLISSKPTFPWIEEKSSGDKL